MASFAMDSSHRVLWMAFIDQGEFEVMKILDDHRTPCYEKYHFHAKTTVSTQAVFEISLLSIVV